MNRLKDLREDKDLFQKDIAKILNIAQTTYSDYEMGKVRIPLECVIELAKLYDVSMDYISGVSDIKNKFPIK